MKIESSAGLSGCASGHKPAVVPPIGTTVVIPAFRALHAGGTLRHMCKDTGKDMPRLVSYLRSLPDNVVQSYMDEAASLVPERGLQLMLSPAIPALYSLWA